MQKAGKTEMFKKYVNLCTYAMPQKLFGRFDVAAEPFKRDGNKVFVYYLGAGFCPWCAAERWSIVEALKYFGTWEELKPDKSAEKNEPFLNLPTYNFHGAKFKSDYVEFAGKEFQDRNFQDLEHFTDADNVIIDNYNMQGVIPFTFIADKYVRIGSGPKPQQLDGLSRDDVKNSLGGKTTVPEEVKKITAEIK